MTVQTIKSNIQIDKQETRLGWLPKNPGVARQAMIIGLVLAVLQILDGVLTSIGISRFGLGIEANPFLRGLMEDFGHVTTLAFVKILAIVVVAVLTLMTRKLPWIKGALTSLSAIYLLAAILPWTYILFVQPYV